VALTNSTHGPGPVPPEDLILATPSALAIACRAAYSEKLAEPGIDPLRGTPGHGS